VGAAQAGNATWNAATNVNQSFTVAPAQLTVTANSRSKTYGQAVTFAGTEFTTSGLLGSDTVTSVSLNSSGAAPTAAVAGSSYVIVPSNATGTGLASYTINYVNGSLTVNQAALTVTASAQSKTYGQTVTFGSGSTQFSSTSLQNSETIGSVTLAVSGSGDAATAAVGSYIITPSAAAGGTFTAANYNITYNTGTLTVNPATLNVSANGTLVYGQDPSNAVYSPFYYPLQGTDTFSVVSGSADFSTDATATNSVGANYTVFVLDTGTLTAANYSLVAGTNGVMTITPAPLTVTNVLADDKTYDGTTNATIDASDAGLEGIVNGDDVTLNTAGATGAFADASAGTGKTVFITGLTLNGTSAANYSLTQPTTTADITPASSAIVVISSANPSLPGSNVTFTASVSILPPGGGAVDGTVQFLVDGASFGAPAILSGGVASLSSSALTHGYHAVAAEYADNGNFYGSTNSLNQLVNTPPVGANITMSAMKNQSTNLSATKLVFLCTDADGDAMNITAVAANSDQGGTVLLSGATITYTPPADYTGPDSFTYTVSDTFGATGTGTVSVTVQAVNVSLVIQTLSQLPDGNMQVMASGIPGDTYLIQASTDLNTWATIGTNAADSNGIIAFPDLSATNYTSRFYRLAAP
jgi:hypothetical protein